MNKESRRDFIKKSALAGIALGVGAHGAIAKDKYSSNRPAPSSRKFTSRAVEKKIKEIKKAIADPELAWMFENCFPNTLDTTVETGTLKGKPDTFVITGDIPAMWLRDSTAQVWPYLPLLNEDEALKRMVLGLVNRQTACILIDPYANAFNKDGSEESHWKSDHTKMRNELHERKWEIDSLCYSVRLAYGYWKRTGDASCLDADWRKASKLIVQTFKEQQRKDGNGPYSFQRTTSKYEDNVPHYGWGNPVKPVGLICSIFRPSDDSTVFPFLVPSNYFAVASLRQMAEMHTKVHNDRAFAKECNDLADEVEEALEKYAVAMHESKGKIIPFEVDGFGNRMLMDDANVPSLLSLPYLDAMDAKDPLYQRTRDFVLSEDNPYFWKGDKAEGIGGPHVGMHYIWPMSITMRALTSDNEKEIRKCLRMLKDTHAGTGFMHEGFHKDNPEKFTRSWFAWANTLFGELVMKTYNERPHILRNSI
ncbi:hypothetical protein FUAX_42260 (plasmid) [Fulvitalea axinellae]|uniref:Metal-independent alpha-mannosidase n=1 Tax=Fulvitalea axinellae TaxID=1182444 RepID=A0AAU9DB55_9BACT|nr:hypothetical protein FUAX_42260 [Fulvitalea axinellae]